MQQKNYQQEILALIHSGLPQAELAEKLSDYHENDLADALAALTPDERQKLYAVLGVDTVAEIFSYLDDAEPYLKELPSEKAANVVSHMDSDDAVDALDDLEEEDKAKIVGQLDKDSAEDVKMLLSYGEDEIGSSMTTNYICIRKDMTIRQAMSELVKQAGENDNISTLYVVDENDKFYGAIDLKDLIIARAEDRLEKLIARSYPYVTDHEKISDCIDRIVDYAERSLPVLNDAGELVGIITSADVVELVDDEMGDDYAKLGGLTSEEDLNEGVFESVKKRLPWLIALLFLGMLVSSVVGAFESVVAVLPIVICFQSMVLDMAGNVGTQSLAVTIRVLVDENLTTSKKLHLLWKEMRVGLVNGALLAVMALGFLGCYIHFFKAYAWGQAFLLSGCVGVSLIVAMVISSLVGTVIPMLFHKIHIDPAVASGGELSRIMLAIKTVLAETDQVPTLIFDEIDTGISGRTAQMVSEKLRILSKCRQVICITHLPQIAAMADQHFEIRKSASDGRTATSIRALDREAMVDELARLLGGAEITETVRQNAEEMKKLAKKRKLEV